MTDLDLGIQVFKALILGFDRRFWGTTLIDAFLPLIETWDIETESTWVIVCYSQPEQREDAVRRCLATTRTGYREYKYCTGVIPAVATVDGKLQELEFIPTEDDEKEYQEGAKRWKEESEKVSRHPDGTPKTLKELMDEIKAPKSGVDPITGNPLLESKS